MLRRLAVDLLMAASVAGLFMSPFWLAGCEPWRPLTNALANLAERLMPPNR